MWYSNSSLDKTLHGPSIWPQNEGLDIFHINFFHLNISGCSQKMSRQYLSACKGVAKYKSVFVIKFALDGWDHKHILYIYINYVYGWDIEMHFYEFLIKKCGKKQMMGDYSQKLFFN